MSCVTTPLEVPVSGGSLDYPEEALARRAIGGPSGNSKC
jgi:hypothetical protein